MRIASLASLALALSLAACDFSPVLGDVYPACVDGACLVPSCACVGGQVCVSPDPALGPEACLPSSCEEGLPCDDGDACTQGERCADGLCQGGAPVDCDDQDACTEDGCDPGAGCTYLQRTDLPPEAEALCANGLDDDCDGLTDEVDPGCRACVEDTDCDDGNPCSLDTCAAGDCHYQSMDQQPCDDGVDCTVGDICQGTVCVPGNDLLDRDGDDFADAACGGEDCDDLDALVFPGSPEIGPGSPECEDGKDNDCDEAVDYADPSCQGGPPVGPLCSPLGWCWENPLPQGNDLLGVWGQGSAAWAVGPNGLVVRIDANGLALEDVSTFVDLRAIHGDGTTLVAAGGTRVLVRTNGVWSSLVLVLSGEEILDVWVEPGGRYWLAGTQGLLRSVLGVEPVDWSIDTPADLLAVSAESGLPWVADSLGARLRWAGNGWVETGSAGELLPCRDLAAYRSADPGAPLEALAVAGEGRVERFRGGSWSTEFDAAGELYGLFWDPALGGAVAGDGRVLVQEDSTSGTWAELGGAAGLLRGVWSRAGAGSLGAGVVAVGLRGGLFGKAGATPLSTTSMFTSDLRAISCVAGHAWAVGAGGTIVEITVDENAVTSWHVFAAAPADLRGVWGGEDGRAWAVGASGQIVRIEGGDDFAEGAGVSATLRAVTGLESAVALDPELWAVGEQGTMLHRKDGAWTGPHSVTGADLHALSAQGTAVWAVGDDGTVVRCAQDTCLLEPLVTNADGTSPSLRAVVMLSSEEGYAGAEDGSIYRWTTLAGWQWMAQPVPGRAIRAMSARYIEGTGWDVWAVGDRGLALNLSPIGMLGWHQVQIGANVDLHGLCSWLVPEQGGGLAPLRAVGAGGAVLSQR